MVFQNKLATCTTPCLSTAIFFGAKFYLAYHFAPHMRVHNNKALMIT